MKGFGRIGLTLLTLAAVGSVAAAAGRAFWHLAGESGARADRVQLEAPDTGHEAKPVDLGSVMALAPFGSSNTGAEDGGTPTATEMDLKLRGVVLQANPALSYAMIEADGRTRSYAPGDPVAEGAVLAEIGERHVILEVNGERQLLGFPNMDPGELAPDQAETTEGPEAPQSNLDRLRAALGVASGSYEIKDPPPPETTEDYINLWRERIIRNPNQVLDEIGLIATEKGYMIGDEHDPGVELAGLKAGDRVARVNGQAVGNVEQDRKFFDEVAASGVARLEVVRDGRTFVMSFPLR